MQTLTESQTTVLASSDSTTTNLSRVKTPSGNGVIRITISVIIH